MLVSTNISFYGRYKWTIKLLYMFLVIISFNSCVYYCQVVIAVSQIMLCRDITTCLSSEDGDIQTAIRGAEKKCFDVRS